MPPRRTVVSSELSQALTRQERLRRRPDFLRVQNTGARARGRYVTLFVLPNHFGLQRLGIIATRRLGTATVRNRSKRLVREIFRQTKNRCFGRAAQGIDLVVLPRPGFSDVPFAVLRDDYLATFRRYARG